MAKTLYETIGKLDEIMEDSSKKRKRKPPPAKVKTFEQANYRSCRCCNTCNNFNSMDDTCNRLTEYIDDKPGEENNLVDSFCVCDLYEGEC